MREKKEQNIQEMWDHMKWHNMYNVIEISKEEETKEIFKETMARSFSVSVTDTKPLFQEIQRPLSRTEQKPKPNKQKHRYDIFKLYKFENRKILKIP